MTVDNIPVNVANKFTLSGKLDGREIIITYSTVDGPLLTLQRPPSDLLLEFRGKDLVQQDTEIGTLITVVLEQPSKPEGTEVQLSVLLPFVNLGPVGEKNPVQADVKTEAILTTQKVGILPRPIGQSQTYEFVPLTGTASFQRS
ncbi:MAG: hypothetical protein PUP93_03515 [Rhizonema sp. NSF051]|nr:hypothetical protein [Rhizonema sp. NSF051]